MRIILIQHGLKDRHTHYYGETLGWAAELRRRGLDHRVYIHKDAPPDIVAECGGTPIFSFETGARFVKDPVTDQLETFLRFADAFAKDCRRIPEPLGPQDVVVIAFATERELFGAAQWLASMPAADRPQIVLHFVTPEYRWTVGKDRTSVRGDMGFHRFAANQLAAATDRFHLLCGAEQLCRALSAAFSKPVTLAPLPMTYSAADDLAPAASDPDWQPAHAGFLGEFRSEKGAEFLPEIVEGFCRARPGRRVFLQIQHEGQADPVRERLGALEDVELYVGQLSQRAYAARLETLDILLIPYKQDRYAMRTSGLFAEAIAYGLLPVVPARTWMADQLAAGRGQGVAFAEATAESVLGALLEASGSFESLKAGAQACRKSWRETHSLGAFLDLVLEKAASAT